MRGFAGAWLTTAVLATLARPGAAAPGDLDPTFASGGGVTTPVGARAFVNGLFLDPDGKIVVAGNATDDPNLFTNGYVVFLRYDAAGAPDVGFGSGGLVSHADGHATIVDGRPARQDDGAIVVPGLRDGVGVLIRYLPDGSLDPSFGTGGVVTVPGLAPEAVAMGPGATVITAAQSGIDGWQVRRYLGDGTLDTTFATGGIVTENLFVGTIADVLVTADAKTVVAAKEPGGFSPSYLVRYLADGARDATFGNGGLVTGFPGDAESLTSHPAGGILLAGLRSVSGLALYADDGAPDAAFGPNGIRVAAAGIGYSTASQVLVDAVDRILLGGGADDYRGYPDITAATLLVRRLADGHLDPTFGAGGKAIVPGVRLGTFALQPDGRIIGAGGSTAGVTVARVDAECPSGPDADADGIPDGCDPCVGPTFTSATLRVGPVSTETGSASFHFRGRVAAPGVGPLDAVANGIVALLDDATGRTVQSVLVPAGSMNATTGAGWSAIPGERGFRYSNAENGPNWIEGLQRIVLSTDDAGELRVRLDTKTGNFPLDPALVPLRVILVLTPPRSATGRCATVAFAPERCTVTHGRVRCKQS